MNYNKMVQSIIDLGEHEDRVLNIVKAQHGFKNKSQAVAFITQKYEAAFLEPELQPEFIETVNYSKKQTGLRFTSVNDLRKHIENDA